MWKPSALAPSPVGPPYGILRLSIAISHRGGQHGDAVMLLSGIREWFRWYKTPDGKPINGFGHGEACLDADVVPREPPRGMGRSQAVVGWQAMEVVQETHQFWKDLKVPTLAEGCVFCA